MATLLTSDGTSLYYEDVGKGPAIVFIHGWYTDHRYFKGPIEVLKSKYRCISFDLRGHGLSETPFAGRTIDRLSKDLHELIEYLDLDNVTLVGHSMGGLTIYSYIHAYGTKKINALCVLDMSPCPYRDIDWDMGAKALGFNFGTRNTTHLEQLINNWQVFRPFLPFLLIPWAMAESFVPKQLTGPNPPSVVASFWCAMLDVDYSKCVSNINVPFTYITSERPIYGLKAINFLKANVKSTFNLEIIDGANHITMIKPAEKIAKIIEDTLKIAKK